MNSWIQYDQCFANTLIVVLNDKLFIFRTKVQTRNHKYVLPPNRLDESKLYGNKTHSERIFVT